MPLAARIGAMRELLALQSNTQMTSTGEGFRTDSWATYATVCGEYLAPPTGREAWMAESVTAELRPVFRIRYRTDVLPKHRAVWRGLILEIHAVIPLMTVGTRFLRLETGLIQ